MATSNVSAIDNDVWQLVATNSPTSGTTITFSGLTGYKKYMLVANNLTGNATTTINITFNGSSTGYASMVTSIERTLSAIQVNSSAPTGYNSWVLNIDNANSSTGPKTTQGWDWYQMQQTFGIWDNTSPITSIVATRPSGVFTGGTLNLYGIAG